MKKFTVFCLLVLFFLSGCAVRTYSVKKDRVDQEVGGNQGFIAGSVPAGYTQPKNFTQRDTRVVEIELKNPLKFKKSKPKAVETTDIKSEDQLTESQVQTTEEAEGAAKVDTYVVQKNDTLQKISARPEIYGTTKKWIKIYNANKDKLTAPDKIYPGQELRIPRD